MNETLLESGAAGASFYNSRMCAACAPDIFAEVPSLPIFPAFIVYVPALWGGVRRDVRRIYIYIYIYIYAIPSAFWLGVRRDVRRIYIYIYICYFHTWGAEAVRQGLRRENMYGFHNIAGSGVHLLLYLESTQ